MARVGCNEDLKGARLAIVNRQLIHDAIKEMSQIQSHHVWLAGSDAKTEGKHREREYALVRILLK